MLNDGMTFAMMTPMFALSIEKHEDDDYEDAVYCEIDDCECESCVAARGGINPFSTIKLGVRVDNKMQIARLTPEEACELAEQLIRYAELINDLAEEEEMDELERFS